MLKNIPFYASLLNRDLTTDIRATHCHVLVYGAIEVHAMGDRGCIASNKTIAEETGFKESSVKTIISTLAKAEWVKVTLDENNHRTLIEPLMEINPPLIPINPSTPVDPLMGINHRIQKEENSNKENIKEIFVELIKILRQEKAKPLESRLKKLSSRLKVCSPEDLKGSAANLAADPWMNGENDNGKSYATIDYLLRSDENVEKWLHNTPAKKKDVIF